ncbi:MAG: hypothetical protein ACRDWS_10385 [Acidimicrobiia bacterium]
MIFGYLDPGTGSLILQAVVGGLAGIGVAYKAWRSKLGRRDKKPDQTGDEETAEDTALPAES